MEKHMKRLWKMEFLGWTSRKSLDVRQGKALVHLTVFKEEPIMPAPMSSMPFRSTKVFQRGSEEAAARISSLRRVESLENVRTVGFRV